LPPTTAGASNDAGDGRGGVTADAGKVTQFLTVHGNFHDASLRWFSPWHAACGRGGSIPGRSTPPALTTPRRSQFLHRRKALQELRQCSSTAPTRLLEDDFDSQTR
jgi:hypothetical protein